MSNFFGDNLFFIISQPRSGSTLLQRILSGHPEIHSPVETWLMLHPLYALKDSGYSAEYNSVLAYTAVNDFLDTLVDGPETYYDGIRSFAAELYLRACTQARKKYFLDKTPRYYFIIPELFHTFPNAKFIFLFRNPLAVLASILNTNVEEYWLLLARYRDDLISAPLRMLEGIDQTGSHGLVLNYEILVQTPESTIKKTCDFLGVTYENKLLDYGDRPQLLGRMGDQTEINKHTKPVTSQMTKWLNLARSAQTRHLLIEYLNELGVELLDRMGYSYAQLSNQINSTPCLEGRIQYTWKQLLYPDQRMERRLVRLELALLQHRRIVHEIKSWGMKILNRSTKE